MSDGIYGDGSYGAKNPDWHAGDAVWKAKQIAAILTKNEIEFKSCVEVGCGTGLVLEHLEVMFPGRDCVGFDISSDAAALWSQRKQPSKYFQDNFVARSEYYDLALLIDVVEHVDDYLGFLRSVVGRANWFVFHFPLDMHVSGLLRDRQLDTRGQVGHLHYFSQATARATLLDAGYAIVDTCLTKTSQETGESVGRSTRFLNVFRRLTELLSIDWSAKLFGGYSLLVLAKGAQYPRIRREVSSAAG